MSGERDIFAIFREYHDARSEWHSAIGKDREQTLELAGRLVALADEIAECIRGDALSIQGGSLLLTDDLESAENCLLKAMIQQKDAPGKGATLRRLALLRALQGLYQDAECLAMKAAEIAHNLGSEKGDAVLALGEIRYIRGMYDDAAKLFLESMQYLDEQSSGFRISTHNFMCALVKCSNPKTVSDLLITLKSYVSQSSNTWTRKRAEWMLGTAYVRIGKRRKAVTILSGVATYLREHGSAPEIAACNIDLAEAHYGEGEMRDATISLQRARDTLAYVHGHRSEVVRNLDSAVRSQCKDCSPWEVRRHIPLQA